jgi:type IX secretion system PorP/SprF family membrane protein
MKKIITVIIAFAALKTNAQQIQTSSLFDLQGMIHNPSLAGSNGSLIGGSYRTQWNEISGSPKTAMVFGSFDLPSLKIGLGGYLYNDETGPTSRRGVQLAFAKHIPVGDDARFSLGIEAKGLQYSIDRSKLSATLGSDPALGNSDNKFKFDAGFGISYNSKKWQVGAAVSQLIQSKLDFYTGNLTSGQEARLYRHYYLHALYRWATDESNVVTPHAQFIYLPNAPLEFQAGVRVDHKQLFWGGLGFRWKQSLTASAGFYVNKKLMLGYSFDLYRNPVSVFDAGGGDAHEIMLRYKFKN